MAFVYDGIPYRLIDGIVYGPKGPLGTFSSGGTTMVEMCGPYGAGFVNPLYNVSLLFILERLGLPCERARDHLDLWKETDHHNLHLQGLRIWTSLFKISEDCPVDHDRAKENSEHE